VGNDGRHARVEAGMTHRERPHFDGTRFRNPTGQNGRPARDIPKMVSTPRAQWPEEVPVQQRPAEPRRPEAWASVSFVGHSTFIVQTSNGTFITDPVFSERASPLSFIGPKRVRKPGVPLADVPPIDVVLLSHNHYDHCDLAALRAIRKRFDPLLLTLVGNARLARSAGYTRIEELDWWQTATASPVPVVATPAQHFSARTPFDRNRALWGGFVLDVDGRRLFFAGDTGYAAHFREVRHRLGAIDLALLPIGAYEPRWFMQQVHMNPHEAVQAHRDLEAHLSIGMHFGTFQLTAEGIDDPVTALHDARRAHGIAETAFVTLDFGESRQVT
jgi:L-ascorbate metabolism protein UlaG (beta-lactamase superfamily)